MVATIAMAVLVAAWGGFSLLVLAEKHTEELTRTRRWAAEGKAQAEMYERQAKVELHTALDYIAGVLYGMGRDHYEVSGIILARAGRARVYRRYDRDTVVAVRRAVG